MPPIATTTRLIPPSTSENTPVNAAATANR